MKKALITIVIIILIEFFVIAANCNFPHMPEKSEIITSCEKARISKTADTLIKKVTPIQLENMIEERDFFEEMTFYYYKILIEIGYFN